MYIDRAAVKLEAKGLIRDSKPSMIAAAVIYTVLGAVIGFLSLRLTGVDSSVAEKMFEAANAGNSEALANLILKALPGKGETLLDLLLQLALAVVSVGFSLFVVNSVRRTGAVYGNLLDGFGMMPRVLFLIILEYLFIALWSMLFVIPGIVAAYRYSLAVYIMLDHPELSAMDCIRESKRMTRGYKMQLFLLDLSFVLWWFLSALPVVGYAVQIFLTPYVETARVLYYERIRSASGVDVPPYGFDAF